MYSKNKRYHELLNTARWKRLRRDKLSAQPTCEMCEQEGRVRLATEVHHVVPVLDGMSREEMSRLAFDPHNLMSLCAECHDRVHREMESHGKEGNKRRAQSQLEQFKKRFLE